MAGLQSDQAQVAGRRIDRRVLEQPWRNARPSVDETTWVYCHVMRIISTLVLIWLAIGVLAAFQRDYFSGADNNCSDVGTILVTVVAGPLNYIGANPKIDCKAPTPSE